MDTRRFEALVRLLDRLIPRRAALGGGFAILLGVSDAAARKRRKKKKTKKRCKGKKKCGKTCIPRSGCCADAECGAAQRCLGHVCTCPTGFIPCGAACIEDFLCCTDAQCGGDILACQGQVCVCPDGDDVPCAADLCCEAGQVCRVDEDSDSCQAGGCPATDFCSAPEFYRCGAGNCSCVTSLSGVNACVDFLFGIRECAVCASDGDCATLLGVAAVCVADGPACNLCDGDTFCIATGCFAGDVDRPASRQVERPLSERLKRLR